MKLATDIYTFLSLHNSPKPINFLPSPCSRVVEFTFMATAAAATRKAIQPLPGQQVRLKLNLFCNRDDKVSGDQYEGSFKDDQRHGAGASALYADQISQLFVLLLQQVY